MLALKRLHQFIYFALLGLLLFAFGQCLVKFSQAIPESENLAEAVKLGFILVLASSPIPVLLFELGWIAWSGGNWRDSSLARLSKFNFSRESDLAFWVSTQAGILPASVYLFLNTLNITPPSSLAEHSLHLSSFEWIAVPVVHFTLALLLSSFIDYALHFLFHRIPELWELHRVHHSASEMTVLNTFREHFAVTAVNNAVTITIFYLLGLNRDVIFAYLMIRNLHSFAIHSNWQSTWGVVGKFLVSPAAHRIHHSNNREFHDSNYGTDITLWDRIFGTYREASPSIEVQLEQDSLSTSNPIALVSHSTVSSVRTLYRRLKTLVVR